MTVIHCEFRDPWDNHRPERRDVEPDYDRALERAMDEPTPLEHGIFEAAWAVLQRMRAA